MTFRMLALAGCASLALTGAAMAQTAKPIHFDIPAEDLGAALNQLAVQSQLEIVFNADVTRGKRAEALAGDYTPQQALERLLRGTGLRSRMTASGSLVVEGGSPQSEGAQTGPGKATGVQEVVVTGTHISGALPASPVMTITSQAIQEGGYATAGEVIRSLPQNFGGGQNAAVIGAQGLANTGNVAQGDGVNLRGFGSDATLVLINGQRLATSGNQGSVDVSLVPVDAIDRVEVITDAASAIYGSDAIGGVVNFVLKKNFDGAETTAEGGGATDGGGAEYRVDQLFGSNWGTGSALLNYQYLSQDQVAANQRSFSQAATNPSWLTPSTNSNSVFFNLNQDLGPNISTFVNGIYDSRAAYIEDTIAAGPYRDEITNNSSTQQFDLSAGLKAKLGHDWTASVTADASSNFVDDKNAAFLNGTPISDSVSKYTNSIYQLEGVSQGPIYSTTAGDTQLAVGAGYRYEEFQTNQSGAPPEVNRSIGYTFAELNVPIVGPDNNIAWIDQLRLSLAGRYEHYSDFGGQFSPKVGLTYKPVADLTLRGTYSTAFKAPQYEVEYGNTQSLIESVSDPKSPTGVSTAFFVDGVNPNLRPETATPWTVGFDYNPSWMSSAKLSVTYFNINYRDKIIEPLANLQSALTDPAYAMFVTRNPSAALQQQYISQTEFFNNFTTSPYNPSAVSALVNDLYTNVASQIADGVDLNTSYTWNVSRGAIDVFLNSSWLHLTEKLTPTSPTQTISGLIFNPPSFRSRAGLTWRYGPWSSTIFANYLSSEVDNTGLTPQKVGSWTTADAQVSYNGQPGSAWYNNLRVALNIQNLFDTAPPRISASATTFPGLDYDSTNASALGRFIRLTISKKWW